MCLHISLFVWLSSFLHLSIWPPIVPLSIWPSVCLSVPWSIFNWTNTLLFFFFLFFPVRATQEAHHWQTDYSRTNRPSKYSYKSRRANIKQTHKGGDLQPPKPLQTNSACTSSACTNYHDFLKQQNVIKTPRFYTLSSHKAKLYTSLNKKNDNNNINIFAQILSFFFRKRLYFWLCLIRFQLYVFDIEFVRISLFFTFKHWPVYQFPFFQDYC